MKFWVGLALCGVALGCASTPPSSTHGNNSANNGAAASSGSGAAAGTGASGSGSGSFGNTDGSTATAVPNVDASVECEAGTFCKPTSPDPNNCGTFPIKSNQKTIDKPGNVLLIFDRSGSMMTNNWGNTTRFQAAGDAMVQALTPLQDKLTIGAVFFPSDTGGLECNVEAISAADQINFMPGAMALQKMNTGGANGAPMYQPSSPVAFTPTEEAITAADAALSSATLTGATVAIIITDGEPNCQWPGNNGGGSLTTIANWLSQKQIKTYVVGLPGASTGIGPTVLTSLATSGGTMQYLEPTDAATLEAKLKDIVQQTVTVGLDSCTLTLDPKPAAPDKLHVVVTENNVDSDMPRVLNNVPVWNIGADGATVTLTGPFCDAAKAGKYQKITFVYGCVQLPPPKPFTPS